MYKLGHAFCDSRQIRFRRAAFSSFIAQPYFNQNLQLFRALLGLHFSSLAGRIGRKCGVELLYNGKTVHGIHPVEKPRSAACFIPLKMSDQMPCCIQVRNTRLFGLPLLYTILAKMTETRIISCPDGLG